MKILLTMIFMNIVLAQTFLSSEQSSYYIESLQIESRSLENVFEQNYQFAFQDKSKTNPLTPALYSLIIPGLGQYQNGDKYSPYIFLGLEIAAWYIYSSMNSKGDKKEIEVKQFADNPATGFNRILYYKRIYEKAADFEPVDDYNSYFDDFSNEESNYQQIRQNQVLWSKLKQWENVYGDHTHSLPETKTQQYYEMIGKYDQFEGGWRFTENDSRYSFYSNFSINNQPTFISSYYDIRNDMNAYYKTGDWALRAVFVNHIVSALEALIVAKSINKNLDIKYQNNINYYGLSEERITVSYQF